MRKNKQIKIAKSGKKNSSGRAVGRAPKAVKASKSGRTASNIAPSDGVNVDIQFLRKAMKVATSATSKARKVLLDHFGKLTQVRPKPGAGLVSEADVLAEQVLIRSISAVFPEHGFLGEEGVVAFDSSSPFVWVIDPLDGTTNYIHGFPIYAISVALLKGQVPLIGLVDVPPLGRTYSAMLNGGAFCNGVKLHVSKRDVVENSLLATGFFNESPAILNRQMAQFNKLLPRARAVRRAGSAAFDLCMVAEGVFDAFWELNLKPWDTAAGILLVREAGGIVSNFKDQPFSIFEPDILASNGTSLHRQLLDELE